MEAAVDSYLPLIGEMETLRREQVRLGEGIIQLPQTKTEPRNVILSTAAQDDNENPTRTHLQARSDLRCFEHF
jgi:hypothetical protein